MNLTLENAEDISEENKKQLGKVLLRGDNILAISLPDEESN
jgi:small nuclear ribonucleoprotein